MKDKQKYYIMYFETLEDLIFSADTELRCIYKKQLEQSKWIYYFYVGEAGLFVLKYTILHQDLDGWITPLPRLNISKEFRTGALKISTVLRDTLLQEILDKKKEINSLIISKIKI